MVNSFSVWETGNYVSLDGLKKNCIRKFTIFVKKNHKIMFPIFVRKITLWIKFTVVTRRISC